MNGECGWTRCGGGCSSNVQDLIRSVATKLDKHISILEQLVKMRSNVQVVYHE